MTYKYNSELKRLSEKYPLTTSERDNLKALLKEKGQILPILLWNGFVVDGHNRLELLQELNIEPFFKEVEFNSLDDAKMFIINNYIGQRNLTDGQKWELTQDKKEILLKKGKDKQKETLGAYKHNTSVLSIVDKTDTHNTREELAKELGWSTGKVAMADKVWKVAPPEIKEKVKTGEVSINQAFTEIRNEEKIQKRKEYIEEQKRVIEQQELIQPTGLFDVIAIDPPWAYGREYNPDGSRVANPYPEMSQSELMDIELPAKNNCVLFLWTTHAFLFDAKQLLDHWGFSYKATLVWDKEKIGMGAWFRMQCEFCLVGIKGKPIFENTSERDIIREARREHSRKPEAFYTMVEKITAGRRLEYFAREKRNGWEVFGNETEKF